MMMAPAMGASAAAVVHHVRIAEEDRIRSSAAFVGRPSRYDECATAI